MVLSRHSRNQQCVTACCVTDPKKMTQPLKMPEPAVTTVGDRLHMNCVCMPTHSAHAHVHASCCVSRATCRRQQRIPPIPSGAKTELMQIQVLDHCRRAILIITRSCTRYSLLCLPEPPVLLAAPPLPPGACLSSCRPGYCCLVRQWQRQAGPPATRCFDSRPQRPSPAL